MTRFFTALAFFLLLTSTADAQITPPTRGGTGTSTIPALGDVLVGCLNGSGLYVYCPRATSTLNISGGGSGSVTAVGFAVPPGFTISGSPVTGSSTLTLAFGTGYSPFLTASGTAWQSFYTTPSSRITAGNHIDWTGNILDVVTTGNWSGTFDNQEGTFYLDRANHSGSQTASTISDFSTTARGLFSSSATGLTYTSGTGAFSLTSGYAIPTTTRLTQHDTAYSWGDHSLEGYITDGNTNWNNSYGFVTAGQTVGTTTNGVPGQLPYWTGIRTLGSVATGTLTENILGLDIDNSSRGLIGGSATLSLTSGYVIPLSASTTNWNTFYNTPSNRITAGTGIDWSGNTLNGVYTAGDGLTLTGEDFDFDGGASPGGELGGTWASPTIDDSLAVTSWNLTTPTLTSFFGTPCTGNDFLQDISDTGAFTCVTATGSGGGSGAWSTTTTNNPQVGEEVLYTPDDVLIGGSASNTAEFNFDVESSRFTIASTTNATGTVSGTNDALRLLGSTTRGIEWNFKTVGDVIVDLVGDAVDWVWKTGTNIKLGTTQWNSGDQIDGAAIAAGTVDISAKTNLSASWPITLTGDALSWSGLATSSALSQGQLVYATGGKTLASIATGTLTESVTGLALSASRALVGGAAALSLDSGYAIPTTTRLAEHDTAYSWGNHGSAGYLSGVTATGLEESGSNVALSSGYTIPLSASTTQWHNFYTTPSGRITAGTNIDWSGNTLNVDTNLANYSNSSTAFIDLTDLSETITGISYDSGTGVFSQTAGYAIPTTTRLTQHDTAFSWGNHATAGYSTGAHYTSSDVSSYLYGSTTRSNLYTAGDALTWSGTTLNFDGGNTPGGELGGTWASPSIDDSLAVTSWNLTTPTLTTNFTFDGVTVTGLSGLDTTVLTGTVGTTNAVLTVNADDDIVEQGLTWNITAATCTGDGNGGALTVNGSNQIVCSADDGGGAYGDADVSAYLYASTTRSNLYTAGDALTWSGTTLNFDGGNAPGGSLGGTWASPTIDDLFLLLSGDSSSGNYVWTGAHDFGGATDFEIPNGTAPTVNVAGEIAYDTTDEQLIVGASANVVPTHNVKIWSATISSTTPEFIAGGLLKVPTMLDGYTMTAIRCSVQGGTSKIIAIEDEATNTTEDITCGTSVTSDDGTITNASVTAAEEMYIDFGATSGAVDNVAISVFGDWLRE